ncbi:hypothetical protein EON65_32950 [archaeon]|nr:MAG: hypothetical protein EON65_32950 [archaeon]
MLNSGQQVKSKKQNKHVPQSRVTDFKPLSKTDTKITRSRSSSVSLLTEEDATPSSDLSHKASKRVKSVHLPSSAVCLSAQDMKSTTTPPQLKPLLTLQTAAVDCRRTEP